jgi:hypothetical protein
MKKLNLFSKHSNWEYYLRMGIKVEKTSEKCSLRILYPIQLVFFDSCMLGFAIIGAVTMVWQGPI